jgi:U3 small nucleolar RNA-associated protein 23
MVRKYLQFYRLTYGIKPPYNLILDGNFIFAALKNKIDIKERVQRVLQGEEVRYYVLKSVLDELRSVGEKAADALQFAQSCIPLDDSRINGLTPTDKTIGFLSESTCHSYSFDYDHNFISLIRVHGHMQGLSEQWPLPRGDGLVSASSSWPLRTESYEEC